MLQYGELAALAPPQHRRPRTIAMLQPGPRSHRQNSDELNCNTDVQAPLQHQWFAPASTPIACNNSAPCRCCNSCGERWPVFGFARAGSGGSEALATQWWETGATAITMMGQQNTRRRAIGEKTKKKSWERRSFRDCLKEIRPDG